MAKKSAKSLKRAKQVANILRPLVITAPMSLDRFMRQHVIKVMKQEPTRVNQSIWLKTNVKTIGSRCGNEICCPTRKAPACGTVGCTGGWAAICLGYAKFPGVTAIAEALGLELVTGDSYSDCDRPDLFESTGHNGRIAAEAGTREHMKQVVESIESFLEDYPKAKRVVVFPKGQRPK